MKSLIEKRLTIRNLIEKLKEVKRYANIFKHNPEHVQTLGHRFDKAIDEFNKEVENVDEAYNPSNANKDVLIITRVDEEIVNIEHKSGYGISFDKEDKEEIRQSIHNYIDQKRNYLWSAYENIGEVLYVVERSGKLEEINTTDGLVYALNDHKVRDIYMVVVESNVA